MRQLDFLPHSFRGPVLARVVLRRAEFDFEIGDLRECRHDQNEFRGQKNIVLAVLPIHAPCQGAVRPADRKPVHG